MFGHVYLVSKKDLINFILLLKMLKVMDPGKNKKRTIP